MAPGRTDAARGRFRLDPRDCVGPKSYGAEPGFSRGEMFLTRFRNFSRTRASGEKRRPGQPGRPFCIQLRSPGFTRLAACPTEQQDRLRRVSAAGASAGAAASAATTGAAPPVGIIAMRSGLGIRSFIEPFDAVDDDADHTADEDVSGRTGNTAGPDHAVDPRFGRLVAVHRRR